MDGAPPRPSVAPATDNAAFYLAPGWLGRDRGEALELEECFGGDRVELTGSVRADLLAGRNSASLAAMARVDPRLARLDEALKRAVLQPLDRAALLRGAGYSQLFVELTARCNERCVHCYADSSPERREALPEALVREVLEDAAELGFTHIQFTGGDPLISPVCAPAVAYAAELGLRSIEIYTNGLALHDRLYAQLAPHRVAFAFSFYSADPATHDAITRTRGSQRRTLAAITRVLCDGLPVRVSIIVMEQNRDHVEATRALLLGLGLPDDAIGMDVQRSVGRGLMTLRSKDAFIQRGTGAGHRSAQGLPFEGRAAVSPDGTVYPCIFSRAFPLGDVRERRLREILRDPLPLALALELDALRAEFARKEAQLACWDCRLRGALFALQPAAEVQP